MALLDVLRSRGVEVRKGRGGELTLCCPFCIDRGESQDTRFRLGVNQRTGAAHCYNCGWASKSEGPKWILIKLGHRSELEQIGYHLDPAPEEKPPEPVVLPDGFELLHACDRSDYWARRAYRYIRKRGVSKKQLRQKLIGYTMTGRFAYRIVFPVLDKGNLVMVVARDFTGQAKAKYLNSVGDKYLYNIQPADRNRESGRSVILSEGILKALKLERLTPIASASVLGHNLTDIQLNQLKEAKYRTVILWPDPDRPGVVGVTEMASLLIDNGFRVKTLWPLPKAQADELADETVEEILRCHVHEYTWGVEQKLSLAACSL